MNCFFGNCLPSSDTQPESPELSITKEQENLSKSIDFSQKYQYMNTKPIVETETSCIYRIWSKIDKVSRFLKRYKMIFSEAQESIFLKQMNFLKNDHHPHLEKVIDIIKNKRGFYQVVYDYIGGSDLVTRFVNLPREEQSLDMIRMYFKAILETMQFCHQNKIYHGKICPENILFQTSHHRSPLKITNFCSAEALKPNCLTLRVGVTCYLSPEFLKKPVLQSSNDIWSCGIILFQLLTGRLPFDKPNFDDLKKGMNYFTSEEEEEIPITVRDLVNKMLVFNYENRVSARQALLHPFFSEQHDTLSLLLNEEIINYVYLSKLRNSVEFLMIFQTLKEEETNVMETMFKEIDTSGDGFITKEEFDQFIDGTEANLQLISFLKDKVYPELDKEGNNILSYDMFIKCLKTKYSEVAKQKLIQTFQEIDQDGSGFISRSEIENIIKGLRFLSISWTTFVKRFDKNKDGLISLQEFSIFITETSRQIFDKKKVKPFSSVKTFKTIQQSKVLTLQ